MHGIVPITRYKTNVKVKPAYFRKAPYRTRARIEQTFGKLKRLKRIALRCEKTEANFSAFVSFAHGFIIIESDHTA